VSRQIGIDCLDGRIRVAQIDPATNRVLQITANDAHNPLPLDTSDGVVWSFGVPDNLCQVKVLLLAAPSEADLRLRAEFELSQTQLEEPELFRFDLIRTGQENRHLGLIYRREALDLWQQACPLEVPNRQIERRYRCRAAALGLGFLNYARPLGGDLVCLADFSRPVAAICLIHQQRIVDLAHLDTPTFPLDDNSARRLAVDFKTVINFRLMALAQAGITVPLSHLVLADAPQSLRPLLDEYFPIGITTPQPDPTRLPIEPLADFPGYLVALGLTVN